MNSSLFRQHNSEVRRRVLVVDDEDFLRNSLYRNLESDGYDVLAAGSGADALVICRKSIHPIDLLVTDLNMPQMTGLELARACSRLYSEIAVLYISGSNPDEDLRADLEGRKRGFLAKPFRKDDLLRKAKELLLMEPGWTPAKTTYVQSIFASPSEGSPRNGVRRKS